VQAPIVEGALLELTPPAVHLRRLELPLDMRFGLFGLMGNGETVVGPGMADFPADLEETLLVTAVPMHPRPLNPFGFLLQKLLPLAPRLLD
jgi:hypothetical protein